MKYGHFEGPVEPVPNGPMSFGSESDRTLDGSCLVPIGPHTAGVNHSPNAIEIYNRAVINVSANAQNIPSSLQIVMLCTYYPAIKAGAYFVRIFPISNKNIRNHRQCQTGILVCALTLFHSECRRKLE